MDNEEARETLRLKKDAKAWGTASAAFLFALLFVSLIVKDESGRMLSVVFIIAASVCGLWSLNCFARINDKK